MFLAHCNAEGNRRYDPTKTGKLGKMRFEFAAAAHTDPSTWSKVLDRRYDLLDERVFAYGLPLYVRAVQGHSFVAASDARLCKRLDEDHVEYMG